MIIGSKIYSYGQLTSTNTEALRLMKETDVPEGAVICAAYQSAGRGQKGNKWESEENKNLLISTIIYPTMINPAAQFFISMAISLGICDFIRMHIKACTIKWPNDIYVNSDKIAGVLIENSIMDEQIEYSIAGMGLNINQEHFFTDAPNPVSLKLLTGFNYDLALCLNQLTACLDKRYKQLISGDFNHLKKEYISQLYRFGEWHQYCDYDGIFSGRIETVGDDGRIILSRPGGELTGYDFREVDFIL